MKRVIVKEGKRESVTETSGQITPVQESGDGPLDHPQLAEEKLERSPSDLEKGASRDPDGVENVKGEKGER